MNRPLLRDAGPNPFGKRTRGSLERRREGLTGLGDPLDLGDYWVAVAMGRSGELPQ